MSPEERASMVIKTFQKGIAMEIEDAVMEERERCVKMADHLAHQQRDQAESADGFLLKRFIQGEAVAKEIADLIRALS